MQRISNPRFRHFFEDLFHPLETYKRKIEKLKSFESLDFEEPGNHFCHIYIISVMLRWGWA